MRNYVSRAVLLVAASAGAMAAGTAWAQDAVPQSGEPAPATGPQGPGDIATGQPGDTDVVVTGTRAALESAENAKRNSNVVIDGISADDIGSLPDASMSEAIIRVPGIYSNDNGAISARGLGPDFIQQELNGRILPSPAAGNRRVQTGSFPTEGITGLYAQKTTDASTIEGAAGGTILLETIHPLETRRNGLEVVIRGYSNTNSAKLSHSPYFTNVAPRVSTTYVKRFTDNFGLAFTYAWIRQYNSTLQNDGSAWRFGTAAPRLDLNGDGNRDALPSTLGVQINATNDFRNNISSMAQWDITPSVRLSLDGFYNDDKFENRNRRYFAFQLFQGTAGAVNSGPVNSATVNEYNTVVALNASAAGYRGIINTTLGHDKTFGGGFNTAFDDGGRFKFKIDTSYFKATRRDINPNFTFENDAITAGGAQVTNAATQRIPFSYDVSDPFNSVYNFVPLNVDDYSLSNGSIGTDRVDDTIAALRADFTYTPPENILLKSVAFGARADRRHKTSAPVTTSYTFGTATDYRGRPDLDSSFLLDAYNPVQDNIRFVSGTNYNNFPWYDVNKLAALRLLPGTSSMIANGVIANFIDDTENTMAAYAQMNLERGLFTGDIGFRYIQTDTTIFGLQGVIGNTTFGAYKSSYHKLLPSFNSKFAITPTLAFRLSFGKTLTRPNYSDTKAGFAFNSTNAIQNGFVTATQGNPYLRPYISRGVDATLEWYPSRSTSISIASYVKYITGYLAAATDTSRFFTVTSGGITQTLPSIVTTTVNDSKVRKFGGFEINVRQDFTFLPGLLAGFGINVNWNHSYTTAIENVASLLLSPTVNVTANNFAKDIINTQLYYSRGPADLRLAYRYFSTNSQTLLAPQNYRYIPGGTLDISGGYNITDNVRVLFSVTNIFYQGAYQYVPDYRYPGKNYQTNRSLLLNTSDMGKVIQAGVRFHF